MKLNLDTVGKNVFRQRDDLKESVDTRKQVAESGPKDLMSQSKKNAYEKGRFGHVRQLTAPCVAPQVAFDAPPQQLRKRRIVNVMHQKSRVTSSNPQIYRAKELGQEGQPRDVIVRFAERQIVFTRQINRAT